MKIIKIITIFLLLSNVVLGQKFELLIGSIEPINTNVTEVKFKGKKALKVNAIAGNKLAIVKIPKSNFENGIIEFEMASNRQATAHPDNRGFAGLAFHVAEDNSAFDCIYLRATNGRSDNQVQRNHTVQYFAQPDFHFPVLREKFPEKYETYLDVVPYEWIKLRIEIKDRKAKLYAYKQNQPTLVVSELLNKNPSGGIALWVGGGTDAYFTNFKIIRTE